MAPPSRSLADLGEGALIERLARLLPAEPRWLRSGRTDDDAAILALDRRRWWLLTCDVQVEGRHFRRDWLTPRQLGRRAAAVNLSDIAAMGGTPRAALVSLVLPGDLPVRFHDELMRGLGEMLAQHGAHVAGGNYAAATRGITVDVTLLGEVSPRRVVRRAGARPGDRILVTGAPGESRAGLERLRRGARGGVLVRRFLQPAPRVREGQLLARGGVTSMTDVSDGLVRDLEHLCLASRVGARLEADRLPVSRALRRERGAEAALAAVLAGGEDYELLCTAPPARVETLRRAVQRATGTPLTDIGEVLPARAGRWLEGAGGRRRRLDASAGYEHFASRRRP